MGRAILALLTVMIRGAGELRVDRGALLLYSATTMLNENNFSPGTTPISVVVGHRHTLLREGLAALLNDSGFRALAHAETGEQLCQLAGEHNPDMAIMDWELPGGGADCVRALGEAAPGIIVVILTRPQPREVFQEAMQAGASGYLSVNLSATEFLPALRMLQRGDLIVSRELAPDWREELTTEPGRDSRDDLSDREKEVLGLLSHGATNREIAEALTITENTVKAHLRRILDKLNLRNRQQAAAYAAREGLTPREAGLPTK